MFTNIRTVSVEPSNVPKTKQPHILRMSDHLNKAIIENKVDVITFLIENGANVNMEVGHAGCALPLVKIWENPSTSNGATKQLKIQNNLINKPQ